MTHLRDAFGKALKTLRKARGLTQEDFSLISSRTYLSSLERGKKSPTLDKVQDLAQIIGVHPLSLLTLTCLHCDNQNDIDQLIDRVKAEIGIEMPKRKNPMIRLLITDDHAIMREGIKQVYALTHDVHVVGEASNGDEAIERLEDGDIDMLLLDMSMPGLCGKDLIKVIRNRHPALPILVLSMHMEPKIAQSAFDAGAHGYLTKDHDPETLFSATRAIADGGRFLDPKLAGLVNFTPA